MFAILKNSSDEFYPVMKRILLAGLFHETHTFLKSTTRLEDFEILRGDELFSVEGDASPLAGVLEVARTANWQIVPALDYRAMPSAMVEDIVVENWWREFEGIALNALHQKLDGIFLILHGAMVSETIADVEGEILKRIRAIPELKTLPIGGVTDLHANFSPAMAQYSNALITYRKNPHTDAKETAIRAAQIFDAILMSGENTQTVFVSVPILWPPTGTGTSDEPMSTLESMAREIESSSRDILAVNVHAGFSFADTPDTGVAFSAITIADQETTRAELQNLCDYAMKNKDRGNVIEPPIESVMPQVQTLAAQGATPIVLVEPSDNIGGGAPGDGTGVLRALLKHEIKNSAVVINDARAVAEIFMLNIGACAKLKISDLEIEAELISVSDGKFELEDKQSHLASIAGSHIEMGDCAVIKSSGVFILLTSRKTPPMDLGQLRSQGLFPEKLAVIGVKAAVAHRRAYDPISKHSFTVSTPGPCSSDLKSFGFQKVRRPIYPLDD